MLFSRAFRNVVLPTLIFSFLTSVAVAQPDQQYQLKFYTGQWAFSDELDNPDFSNGITLEGWFFFEDGYKLGTILGFDEFPKLSFFQSENLWLHTKVQVGNSALASNVGTNVTIPRGEWVHLAGSYDNQKLKLYINNTLAGEEEQAGQLTEVGSQLKIGGFGFGDGFRGFARDIRVWKIALSQAELQAASQSPIDTSDPDLVANWRLNNGSDSLDVDVVSGARLYLGGSLDLEEASVEPGWHLTNPFYLTKDDNVENIEEALEADPIGSISAWGVADFNNDGFQDFVYNGPEFVGSSRETPFRIFLNNRMGEFNEATSEVIEGDIPKEHHSTGRTLVVADLNGDGLPDIFSGNTGIDTAGSLGGLNTLLLSNQATGKLVNSPDKLSGPACNGLTPEFEGQTPCAEVDFKYMYPDSSAQLTSIPADFTHSISHADIDNDGDIDLFVGNISTQRLHVNPYFLLNDGQGHFTASWEIVPTQYMALSFDDRSKLSSKLFDLDGDGHSDLILGAAKNSGPEVDYRGDEDASYIIWGDGTGNFKGNEYLEIPGIPGFELIPGPPLPIDINNDGRMDLVLPRTPLEPSYDGRYLQVLGNQGARAFNDLSNVVFPVQNPKGDWVASTTTLDFDSNGCDDILLSTDQNGQVQTELIWLSDCAGNFTQLPNAVLGKLGFLIPIDVHNDGDIDFIVSHKKRKNFGDNATGVILAFALLEKIRPINISEFLAANDCVVTLACPQVSTVQPNTASVDLNTGELLIPVLDVNGAKYQVYMSILPDTNPLRLQVDLNRLSLLSDPDPANHATVDGVDITVPRLAVPAENGGGFYSLVLSLISDEPVILELKSAVLLPD